MATWVSFRARVEGITLQNPAIQVMYGDTASAYFVACQNYQSGASEEIIVSGLTIGSPYFIRVFSTAGTAGDGSFSLCVLPPPPPPANDNCANAAELISNSGLTCTNALSGTTLGATPGTNTGCNGSSVDDDVWYYFTATAPIQIISLDYTVTHGNAVAFIQVFSGACNALSATGCFVNNALLENLTVGNVYRVRVYTENASSFMNFTICLRTLGPPPPNDECGNAVNLPVNGVDCITDVSGSTAGGTTDFSNCLGVGDDAVWFSFTATSSVHIVSLTDVTPFSIGDRDSLVIEAWSGDCADLNLLKCNFFDRDNMVIAKLTPGDTYYLKVFSFNRTTYLNFNICVTTPPAGPANDICATATVLTAGPTIQCDNPVEGTTAHAYDNTTVGYDNGGPEEDDVWYRFTAVSPVQTITVQNLTITQPVIEIYGGSNCNLLKSIYRGTAFSPTGNVVKLDGFEPGATYFVRVYSNGTSLNDEGTFTICVTSAGQLLINDSCNGAIELIANEEDCANPAFGTTIGANQSSFNKCYDGTDDDVWFRFTAVATEQRIRVDGITIEDPVLQVFSGSCDTYLYFYACVDEQTGSTEQTLLTNLVVGTEYLVRIHSRAVGSGQGTFTICLQQPPPPPVNDNCATATELITSPGLTCNNALSGTTESATQSMTGCVGVADDDVWYYFTATSSRHIIEVNDVNGIVGDVSSALQVFSGPCNALVSIYCEYGTSAFIDNLTAGAVYRIRIYTLDNNAAISYSICVKTPPPSPVNDGCAGAINLPVNNGGCSLSVSSSTAGATSSNFACSFEGADDDVWFSFVATGSVHVVSLSNVQSLTLPGDTLMVMQAFSGTCNNISVIKCGDGKKMVLTNLVAGKTYFITVFTYHDLGYATFDICVSTPSSGPANNTCSGATTLIPGPTSECPGAVSGSTVDAYNSGLPACAAGSAEDDVWYKFTATSTAHAVAVYAVTIARPVIEIYTGDCNNQVPVFCLSEPVFGDNFVKMDGLTIGSTYFIRIYSYGQLTDDEGAFSVCVTTIVPLANDPCDGAIDLPVNSGADCTLTVKGNNVGSSSSPFPACKGYADDDVWYKFTATSSVHTVSVDSSSVWYLVVEVLHGPCNALTSLQCIDNTNNSSEKMTLYGLVPGEVYYIRVFSENQFYWAQGSFRVCVGTVALPANDNCPEATSLTVTPTCANPLAQNSESASPSSPSTTNCTGNPDDDLWFSFEATAPVQNIVITSGSDYFAVIEVFKGGCSGTFVGCKSNAGGAETFTYPLTGLEPGTTYYARVFNLLQGGGEFSICVKGITSGTEDASAASAQINIYPNPVNNLLTIETPETTIVKNIEIFDPQSRVCMKQVATSGTALMDMSLLPSGIYLVRIQTEDGFYYGKVIKL